MELIQGKTLTDLLQERKVLSLHEAAFLLSQLCATIDYSHGLGLVHRDIKPHNIMVDQTGRAVLMDFGLVRVVGKSAQTMAGLVVGTPGYLAPEQALGQPVSTPADIYSLGVLAYQLLSGRLPFVGDTMRLLYAHAHEIPLPLQQLRPDLPASVGAAIDAALAKDPQRRPPRASLLAQALTNAVHQRGGSPPLPASAPPPLITPARQAATNAFPHSGPPSSPVASANQPGGVTVITNVVPPTGFFSDPDLRVSGFFEGDHIRYDHIQRTLEFYRSHLANEFRGISRQATVTFALWVACVILGFAVIVAGLVLMLLGRIPDGAITTASGVVVYFIQRIFHQREDHYRALAATKNRHLEYGNQWLLIIQSIDAIPDPGERARSQSRLVQVLTDALTR